MDPDNFDFDKASAALEPLIGGANFAIVRDAYDTSRNEKEFKEMIRATVEPLVTQISAIMGGDLTFNDVALMMALAMHSVTGRKGGTKALRTDKALDALLAQFGLN